MENEFLKKAAAFFVKEKRVKDKYKLMKAEKAYYPVTMIACILKVSKSGFYSWLKRKPEQNQYQDLKMKIEEIWLDSDRVFGQRTIHVEIGKKKVLKILRYIRFANTCESLTFAAFSQELLKELPPPVLIRSQGSTLYNGISPLPCPSPSLWETSPTIKSVKADFICVLLLIFVPVW